MSTEDQAISGRLVFMPWVCLPYSVRVGGFRFVPAQVHELAPVIGSAVAETAAQAMRTYVDQGGKPITKCTVVLRPRHQRAWDIPEALWPAVSRAIQILALSCLSEQRFFMGPFSPHLNSTMFRVVGQGITAGSDGIGLTYLRRGGALRVGGRRFSNTVFQQPPQIEGTECKAVNRRLARALERAQRSKDPVWEPIAASLEPFLLGHAETPELGWDTCVMLSAMAFEQVLEPKGQGGAQVLAETFAELWKPYATRTIAQSKRIHSDAKWKADQDAWPIHRKWMKELYEARSSQAHRGRKAGFRQNWAAWQQMVIAAFVYPLVIKLRLAKAGLYKLDDEELGACEALDPLLDSDWGRGWRTPPEWPEILSKQEQSRGWIKHIEKAFADAEARAQKRGGRS